MEHEDVVCRIDWFRWHLGPVLVLLHGLLFPLAFWVCSLFNSLESSIYQTVLTAFVPV